MKRLTLAGFIMLATPVAAVAQIINGDDIVLTDLSPTIAYDDTDTPGYNWVVRGDDFGYSLYDDVVDQFVLSVNPATTSIALGYTSTASGGLSIALGHSATSGGADSTSIGRSAASVGDSSIAFGRDASSSGSFSLAMGRLAVTSAESNQGVALGYSASATASAAVAIGGGSDADGFASVALSALANAAGDGTMALGNNADAFSFASNAIGLRAQTNGDYATALGSYAVADKPYAIVLGAINGLNFAEQFSDVGIGITQPATPLHVYRDDGTAQVFVEDTLADAMPHTLFRLASAGSNAKFEIDNTSADVLWAFTNAGTDFRISKQGSGTVEFSVANNGNATLAGALTQNSDVNAKQAIVPIDTNEVLDKVAALPISQWQYKDEAGVNHIGPMAQDFHAAFKLGADDKGLSSIDTGGVALAAIQGLNQRFDREKADLEHRLTAENNELKKRIAELESLVAQWLPAKAVAQN